MNWMSLLFLLLAVALAWVGFRTIKNNPETFSKENAGRTFQALGLLALALMAFIAVLVMILRN